MRKEIVPQKEKVYAIYAFAMPTQATKVRIFFASPSDTASERQQLDRVVEELNVLVPALAPEKQIVCNL
jgi:hypothetical protein